MDGSIVYEGRVFSVEVEDVLLPNGREQRLAIVRHPASVVLIPVQEDGQVVLIRQYRHAVRREIWELPAGSVDEGESPEAAASRECEEEIGRVPSTLERLGSFFPTPGYCDEEMIFFLASGLKAPTAGSTHKPDEDEDIEVRVTPLAEAKAMAARGDIVDLKTAYALTLI